VAVGAARQATRVLPQAHSPPQWLSGATESFTAAATPEALEVPGGSAAAIGSALIR
jgi:hypothetical protein